MTKDHIVDEIRRTAEANGGKPLGRKRFEQETGIREPDWLGVHWARWSDAVQETGFAPNEFQGRLDDDAVFGSLVAVIRRYGRMPTIAELRLERRNDRTFPSLSVFERFGRKSDLPASVADYCRDRSDCADVLEIVTPLIPDADDSADPNPDDGEGEMGFVYLVKSGRNFKIGLTYEMERRFRTLKIQLPERAEIVHTIRTDDPPGIERYWHQRFAERHLNGEWFELKAADVAAFKRRKFQ